VCVGEMEMETEREKRIDKIVSETRLLRTVSKTNIKYEFNSIQFNSIHFISIQFNSIQFTVTVLLRLNYLPFIIYIYIYYHVLVYINNSTCTCTCTRTVTCDI
jgi:hypothetical protein